MVILFLQSIIYDVMSEDKKEPFYNEASKLWLYGNVALLRRTLVCIPAAFGKEHSNKALDALEALTEQTVLQGGVIVTGIHNDAHRRVAVVPLRWGCPRILIVSGGFYHHLGKDLRNEPFRTARLWRYQFDADTDLVISRRAPDKLPTHSLLNPTVDKLVLKIATGEITLEGIK